jgi:hypothetical protein
VVSAGSEIRWRTPEGMLGTVIAGEDSFFSVQASTAGTDAVTYGLSPLSSPPPQGLSIDAATGNINGKTVYIPSDTTYRFSVRASARNVFADRTFEIRVRALYVREEIVTIFLRSRVKKGTPIVLPYRSIIPMASIFRPSDPNYGFRERAEVYVLGGLDGTKNLAQAISGDGTPYIGTSDDYHGLIKLVLGSHRIAVARGHDGRIAYEVLYRRLHDPQAKAGGFQFNNSTPVEEKVVYRQSEDARYVYPVSLRNIRFDFVRDVGFATSDSDLSKRLGPDGGEQMPLWMRSEQIAGQRDSVLGYVPAVVLAYLKPGEGKSVLNRLAGEKSIFGDGEVLQFDRYYVMSGVLHDFTLFDGENTKFDGQSSFDGRYEQSNKYSGL